MKYYQKPNYQFNKYIYQIKSEIFYVYEQRIYWESTLYALRVLGFMNTYTHILYTLISYPVYLSVYTCRYSKYLQFFSLHCKRYFVLIYIIFV